jgi:hypothetical protein
LDLSSTNALQTWNTHHTTYQPSGECCPSAWSSCVVPIDPAEYTKAAHSAAHSTGIRTYCPGKRLDAGDRVLGAQSPGGTESWGYRVLGTQSPGEHTVLGSQSPEDTGVLGTQSPGGTESWGHRVLGAQSPGGTETWGHRVLGTQSPGGLMLTLCSDEKDIKGVTRLGYFKK